MHVYIYILKKQLKQVNKGVTLNYKNKITHKKEQLMLQMGHIGAQS